MATNNVITYGVYSVVTHTPIVQPEFCADWCLLCCFPSRMDTYGNVYEDSKYLSLVLLPYNRKYAYVRAQIAELFGSFGFVSCNHVYCFSEVQNG